jgi:hypothetical protein
VLLDVLSGLFAALAGVLLAGFGGQASLGMGTPYLFQSVAALVARVSVLLAMNMPDYGRNIIYGVVILIFLCRHPHPSVWSRGKGGVRCAGMDRPAREGGMDKGARPRSGSPPPRHGLAPDRTCWTYCHR